MRIQKDKGITNNMSNLSQCARCDYDRRNCGHYIPEDDTDCPYCMRGGQRKEKSIVEVKTIIHLAFLHTFFSIYVYIKWFDDVRVFYVLAIPIVIFIVWAIVVHMKNRKKQNEEEKVSAAVDRTALECMKLPKDANQSEDFFEDTQKMGDRIEVDFNDLIQNPIKVLIEDVLGLIEIKEGDLEKMRNNPNFSSVFVSSFYVAKMPVNLELWKTLMNEKERSPYRTRVEWDDYLQLLKTLKELTKVDFSFPTSIQWEYATSICDCVKIPSYESTRHLSYVSVGLFNRYKMEWCPPSNMDLPNQILCSMGNGHEELFLFLATSDKYLEINYTKEEMDRVSAIIREIPSINVINKP